MLSDYILMSGSHALTLGIQGSDDFYLFLQVYDTGTLCLTARIQTCLHLLWCKHRICPRIPKHSHILWFMIQTKQSAENSLRLMFWILFIFTEQTTVLLPLANQHKFPHFDIEVRTWYRLNLFMDKLMLVLQYSWLLQKVQKGLASSSGIFLWSLCILVQPL